MPRVDLIAIDWGTSSARAYALDDGGKVVGENNAPLGIQRVSDGRFAEALATLCHGLSDDDVPKIACGMIGSRQGWVEAAYCECPADFAVIASSLTRVSGTRLAIVPGLVCRDGDGVPDVMRGEETQVLGALPDHTAGKSIVVLPGTHSKWVIVDAGRIVQFATFMTGELYAVLRQHSILGRLITDGSGDSDEAALARGVTHSLRAGAALTHDLFSARALALVGELQSDAVADYLSGLLLGAEIASARRWVAQAGMVGALEVTVVGEASLVTRYRRALAIANIAAQPGAQRAAALGLWRIAKQAGMTHA